uniref:Uncharacterized protein n=1 Tax=Rhizophora mucronata TaxID=61149 RepID=A0A2P2NYI0_RHIMU
MRNQFVCYCKFQISNPWRRFLNFTILIKSIGIIASKFISCNLTNRVIFTTKAIILHIINVSLCVLKI